MAHVSQCILIVFTAQQWRFDLTMFRIKETRAGGFRVCFPRILRTPETLFKGIMAENIALISMLKLQHLMAIFWSDSLYRLYVSACSSPKPLVSAPRASNNVSDSVLKIRHQLAYFNSKAHHYCQCSVFSCHRKKIMFGTPAHSAPPHDIGQDRIGQDRIGQDRIVKDRIGQERIGQDRIGQDRIGQDGMVQDRMGQ